APPRTRRSIASTSPRSAARNSAALCAFARTHSTTAIRTAAQAPRDLTVASLGLIESVGLIVRELRIHGPFSGVSARTLAEVLLEPETFSPGRMRRPERVPPSLKLRR